MQQQRMAVIAEAVSFVGTPYHHQGRIKGVGVDCGYLLAEVYAKACGMGRMEFGFYPEDWMMHSAAERYMTEVQARCVEVEQPEPGDIALFQWGRAFSHGAIVIEWPKVVHAIGNTKRQTGGVEYADAFQPPLKDRTVRFFSPWRAE